MPKRPSAVVAGLLLVAAAACTGGGSDGADRSSPPPRTGSATPGPRGSPSPSRPPADPVSIPALIARKHSGSDLRPGRVLARTSAYTRYAVTYRTGGLRVSGVMNIPRGKGPFPALVLAHGHVDDPGSYISGSGTFEREQDLLARNGYVVLQPDYRNHARSDRDPDNDISLRLGYTEDVIGAVLALRQAHRTDVDDERIGLLGRSMGGGVVYNTLVVTPGLVDAAVVYAPVSGHPEDNIDQFQRRGDDPLVKRIDAKYGTPKTNPRFWREVSPLTYVDRVGAPLLIQHGTADASCPIAWSRRTAAAFEKAGKDVDLKVYRGEGHVFAGQWPASMRRTLAFFAQHLR